MHLRAGPKHACMHACKKPLISYLGVDFPYARRDVRPLLHTAGTTTTHIDPPTDTSIDISYHQLAAVALRYWQVAQHVRTSYYWTLLHAWSAVRTYVRTYST